MILVDSSVWIGHLRQTDAQLVHLLNDGKVGIHPFIIGELALGNLQNRGVILATLQDLPKVVVATEDEVFRFIEGHALYGLGIGYIDAHLLASVTLEPGARLWTHDKRLLAASIRMGVSATLPH